MTQGVARVDTGIVFATISWCVFFSSLTEHLEIQDKAACPWSPSFPCVCKTRDHFERPSHTSSHLGAHRNNVRLEEETGQKSHVMVKVHLGGERQVQCLMAGPLAAEPLMG